MILFFWDLIWDFTRDFAYDFVKKTKFLDLEWPEFAQVVLYAYVLFSIFFQNNIRVSRCHAFFILSL